MRLIPFTPIVTALTLLPPGRSAAPAGKPSFVVFLVDDMGIDQAVVPAAQRSCGYTGNAGTIDTPNIYALAK